MIEGCTTNEDYIERYQNRMNGKLQVFVLERLYLVRRIKRDSSLIIISIFLGNFCFVILKLGKQGLLQQFAKFRESARRLKLVSSVVLSRIGWKLNQKLPLEPVEQFGLLGCVMELGLRDRSCTWRGIGSEKQEARVRIIVQYLVKQFYLPAYKIRKKTGI